MVSLIGSRLRKQTLTITTNCPKNCRMSGTWQRRQPFCSFKQSSSNLTIFYPWHNLIIRQPQWPINFPISMHKIFNSRLEIPIKSHDIKWDNRKSVPKFQKQRTSLSLNAKDWESSPQYSSKNFVEKMAGYILKRARRFYTHNLVQSVNIFQWGTFCHVSCQINPASAQVVLHFLPFFSELGIHQTPPSDTGVNQRDGRVPCFLLCAGTPCGSRFY